MINSSKISRAFWSCDTFRGTFPVGTRPWPRDLTKRFRKNFDEMQDYFLFDEESEQLKEFVGIYFEAYGVMPFSIVVGNYTKGMEGEYKFFFLSVGDKSLDLADGDVYKNQGVCGNPPPEFLRIGNRGCGQRKEQIKNLWLNDKKNLPKADVFQIQAGPRFPYARVYGISSRLRQALVTEQITGCEIRPILDAAQKNESGIFQLTITGEANGALEFERPMIGARECDVCGFVVGANPQLPAQMRTFRRDFFADVDLQVLDRFSVRGGVETPGGDNPPLVASGRFIRLIQDGAFTGWNRASRLLEYWPVSLHASLDT